MLVLDRKPPAREVPYIQMDLSLEESIQAAVAQLPTGIDALVNAAAKLPRVAIEAPESRSVIGRTTEEQMHIGIYWGYIAMMEGLVERMKAEIGRPVKVIATGGLAALFDPHTAIFDALESDLTIQGLAMLYERHRTG